MQQNNLTWDAVTDVKYWQTLNPEEAQEVVSVFILILIPLW